MLQVMNALCNAEDLIGSLYFTVLFFVICMILHPIIFSSIQLFNSNTRYIALEILIFWMSRQVRSGVSVSAIVLQFFGTLSSMRLFPNRRDDFNDMGMVNAVEWIGTV
jgi:hypothetical protein